MADQGNPLVGPARAIGDAVGRVVSTFSGDAGDAASETARANTWQAEYLGS